MFNNMKKIRPYSLNQRQEFMWVAEYINGNVVKEFEVDGKENYFKTINRNNLINFGLVGLGARMYYEIPTGKFNIIENEYEISYKTDEKEYNLTNQFVMYNDVIQFKGCCSDFNAVQNNNETFTDIVSYNFGYKVKLNIEDKEIYFKVICVIPVGKQPYLHIRIVSNQDMKGSLIIKKNKFKISEIEAPLQKDVGGEVNWSLK